MQKVQKNLSQRLFFRPNDIQDVYGISRSTAYRLMREGKFPQLTSLSPRCKGWKKSTLDDHFKRKNKKKDRDD